MTKYTAAHWGVYEVETDAAGGPRLKPFNGDPEPSEIGLYQLRAANHKARVLRPAIRQGWLESGGGGDCTRRGQEPFVEVEWDLALDLVARELERVRTEHGNQAIFGGSYGWSSAGRFHHAQSQIHRFLNSIGGYVPHRDSYSIAAAQVLMGYIVAPMSELEFSHSSWTQMTEHTERFIAFGGIPVKNTQVSAGGAVTHRVVKALQAMSKAGCQFVNISPVCDNLEIEGADVEWIPIRPNTDSALMLGIAWVLETEGLVDVSFLDRYTVGYEKLRSYILGESDGVAKTADWASNITGIPVARITSLSREMADHRTMINAAWALQRACFGEQPYWGVVSLAAMLGQIGTLGGGFGVGYGMTNSIGSPERTVRGPSLPQGQNSVETFIPVARISDMLLNPGRAYTYHGEVRTYPDIRLVYWAGGNPFHHHQDINRLREAWKVPETIISHEQFWTASAKHADIVLPATMTSERNDIAFANREGHLVAMQKVLEPAGEARDDFTIFHDLAKRLDVEIDFTEGRDADGWLHHMYEDLRESWSGQGINLPLFELFWRKGVVQINKQDNEECVMLELFRQDPDKHPLTTPSGRIELFSDRISGFALPDCSGHFCWQEPPEWLGGKAATIHPLHLISDQPARRLHSQLDFSDWSQNGKVAGREPIFMHPLDAEERGIVSGDVVTVFNDRGRCLAGVQVSEKIMPGVVRMSTGSWYDPVYETGLDKHGNPNVLTLDIGTSGLSQGSVAQTCLVDVSGPVTSPPPVTAYDGPEFTDKADLPKIDRRSGPAFASASEHQEYIRY